MNIVYIDMAEEADEVLGKWQRRLPSKLKQKIAKNKVKLQKNDEDVKCPIYLAKKAKEKDLQKIGKNIKSTIIANEYKTIVVADSVKSNELIYNELKQFNILNGRWLFNYLVYDIVNYILYRKDIEINKSEISILVNETTDTNVQNILKLAENVKILNIVTDNIAVFKQIEEKLYEEKGIMIRVTNNKKKSLLKSDVIINFDFEEGKLSKYYLPNKRNSC